MSWTPLTRETETASRKHLLLSLYFPPRGIQTKMLQTSENQ